MIIPLEIPVIIRTFHRHAVEAHRRIIPSIVALNQIAFAGLHRWKIPPYATRPLPDRDAAPCFFVFYGPEDSVVE